MSQNLPPKKAKNPDIETTQRIIAFVAILLASPFLMIAMALIIPPAGCGMLISKMSFPGYKNAFMIAMIVFTVPWAFFLGYIISQLI